MELAKAEATLLTLRQGQLGSQSENDSVWR